MSIISCIITDDAFSNMHLPQLKQLILRDEPNVTDALISTVAAGCPQLHSLSVHLCPLLTEASAVEALRCLRGLHKLIFQPGGDGPNAKERILAQLAALNVDPPEGLEIFRC